MARQRVGDECSVSQTVWAVEDGGCRVAMVLIWLLMVTLCGIPVIEGSC